MATQHLVSRDLLLPELSTQSNHPTDSSRLLLGLMTLSRKGAAADDGEADSLDGVISKGVLRSLLSALHHRDVATVRHCRRVGMLAMGVAQYLGWDGRDLKLLEVAALLHDIGKIAVPDNILFKPGALSPDEAELMSLHYFIGLDVLQACRVDPEVLEIVGQSHCDYNGAADGYRRIGSDVHQGARILAVADAYDSLYTDQVYRQGKPHEEILKVLLDSAGTRYDGNVVHALARWIEREGNPLATHPDELGHPERPSPLPPTGNGGEASLLGQIFAYLYTLESLYDGFYLIDSDMRFVVWNHGIEELLGRPSQDLLGKVWTSRLLGYAGKNGDPVPECDCPMNRVIAGGKSATSTVRLKRADGEWLDVELQSVPLLDRQGRLQGVAEIFRDLARTSRRPQEYRDLKLAATRDPLTLVANRGELETQLARMVSQFSESPKAEPFSALFLDIDYFKSINDTYGHAVGDHVLIDLARLLQHEMYSGELVGRYGGEEFVILCPSTEYDQAVRRAERLRVAISNTKIGGLTDFQVTASIGVTEAAPGESAESILRRADKALYMAKESGRNRTCGLTSAEWLAAGALPKPEVDQPTDPFVFTAHFAACVASELIVHKMGGFVTEQRAKLVNVSQNRAVIRVGRRGLLPFWGGTDEERPVELELVFGREQDETLGRRRGASRQVPIQVRIRPLGWIRNAEVFQVRARRVLKELRSYFAADFSTV